MIPLPVTAPVPGLPPVTPAIPIAELLAQALQPGSAAEIVATGGLVDLVSLSPAALLQQILDAPGVAMQQLGSLLQEVEQITQLTSSAAPLAMGELAAEVGAAARELGAGVQALLPSPGEMQTPLQRAAAAALRAPETLASSLRQAGAESAGPAPPSAHSLAAPAPPALPGFGDPPADAVRDAGPDHAAPPADPGREAQAAAGVMLRSAADTLNRMQLRLDAAAPVPDHACSPGFDAAWCEAQIALALAQVARASRVIETLPPAAPRWRRITALLDQRGLRPSGALGRHGTLALLVLLCVATALLWAVSRLDLTLARIAAAVLLALAGLAWNWRRSAPWRQRRVRIALRR